MLPGSAEHFTAFLREFAPSLNENARSNYAADFGERSIVKPGIPTLYLSEVLEPTFIGYHSLDICPGKDTEIFDLNLETLPRRLRLAFDIVLNCGTTEHVLNQLNAFTVIHDAMKVGAIVYHHIPATAWFDHGYFCYHPRLLREIAVANRYETVNLRYCEVIQGAPGGGYKAMTFRLGETGTPVEHRTDLQRVDVIDDVPFPAFELRAMFKKTVDDSFRLPLEIATAHAAPDKGAIGFYGNHARVTHLWRDMKARIGRLLS